MIWREVGFEPTTKDTQHVYQEYNNVIVSPLSLSSKKTQEYIKGKCVFLREKK